MNFFQSIAPGHYTVFDEERYIYHNLLDRQWWGRFDMCKGGFEYQFSSTT